MTFKITLRNGYELVEFNPRDEWELHKKYVGNYTKELPGGWVNALYFCSYEICVPGWRIQGKMCWFHIFGEAEVYFILLKVLSMHLQNNLYEVYGKYIKPPGPDVNVWMLFALI